MSANLYTLTTGSNSRVNLPDGMANQLDALISNALDSLKVELHLRFSEMLNCADQHLSDFPELNETDDTKDKYGELSRILHSERNTIDAAFAKAITEIHSESTQKRNGELTQLSGLSLVDQDEMDEMVAVAAMYSKAMNKYKEDVTNLEARIEYLERTLNKTFPKYTFNPKHICEAFQAALRQVEIPSDYKLLLFKLFDQEVSSRLGEMYRSLNQLFISAGVMPEVVYTVKRHDSDADSTDATSSTPPKDTSQQNPSAPSLQSPRVSGPQHPEILPPHKQQQVTVSGSAPFEQHNDAKSNLIQSSQSDISRYVSQFISGSGTARGEGIPESFSIRPSNSGNHHCYSRSDLMTALSNLQSNLSKVDIDNLQTVDTEHLTGAILADMGRNNDGTIVKRVHVYDQRRIDFVGMMFQAIASDTNISSRVVNLLKLLQIPVTKAAMLDERLFTKKDHPVRNTLDLITKAGRGVTENTDRAFVALKTIVDRLLQDFDADMGSFERAVDALRTLIRSKEKESIKKERIEQQAIIKQHARRIVLGEMRRITLHKVIPKQVRPLILKHWPTLMFNYYINHGIQSREWLGSLRLFNLLMDHLQPITNESQWRALKDNHESLIASVRKELYRTRQDKAEIDAQISALKKTFWGTLDRSKREFEQEPGAESNEQTTLAVRNSDAEKIETSNQTLIAYDYDENIDRIKEEARIAEEKVSKLPSSLHPGVWFEVFNGEDKPVRHLKLSVILTEVAKLIFVDRHGEKVIEKDVKVFLRELDNEQSRFIADHSTFEHALGVVIHKLAA